MESRAYIKNVRISPKKLRFLLKDIKRKKPSEVLDYLFYTPTKSAQVFYKAIKSAIDNAKNNLKLKEEDLIFEKLTVEEGLKLRRFRAGGRGVVKPRVHRYSHIKVILKSTQDKKEVAKPTKEVGKKVGRKEIKEPQKAVKKEVKSKPKHQKFSVAGKVKK